MKNKEFIFLIYFPIIKKETESPLASGTMENVRNILNPPYYIRKSSLKITTNLNQHFPRSLASDTIVFSLQCMNTYLCVITVNYATP